MNIQFNDNDMDKLQEAKDLNDWKKLDTWKQRFIFQKFIALPVNNMKAVSEIKELAQKELASKVQEDIFS